MPPSVEAIAALVTDFAEKALRLLCTPLNRKHRERSHYDGGGEDQYGQTGKL